MGVITVSARTAAAALAEFCAALRWDELEDDVQARTRELVLDLVGVALAGSRQPSSPPAAEVALRLGGSGEASLFGTRQRTSAVWAALANGTAAHAVELDDVTTESSLHPGVAVIPAEVAVTVGWPGVCGTTLGVDVAWPVDW